MPKVVDHDARRRAIADALLRVAAARGLESVSLRHVAAEAGVSSGMVQHYFRTKDEMVGFAAEVVSENVERRVDAAVEALGADPSPAALARALLVELLPVDPPRRDEGTVALAFLAHRAVHPHTPAAERERAGVAQLRAFLTGRVRAEQAAGRWDDEVDADAATTALLALVDGLGVQVLGGHYGPDEALRAFDTCVAALASPR